MILTHIEIPEPVNFVIAAILLLAQTTLKHCHVSVLHHNLTCQFPFPFKFHHLLVFPLEIEVFLKKLKKDLKNCLDEFSSKTVCVTPQN